jgi:hypothetical protein
VQTRHSPYDGLLRDEVETVVRGWDALERGRGGRPIIDYDFAPTGQPVRAASSRLDVYERLTTLRDRARSAGADKISTTLTAYLAYLRAVLGERPPLEEYVRDTQGCATAGWSADYVTEIGHRALEAIAGQGVGWGPNTDDELIQVEKPIDVYDARDRVLEVAAEAEPVLRALTGSTSPYEVTIEIHDVDDYWAYWVDGAGSQVRLRFNLSRATFTEVRLRHFALHEILGHGLQCATYADRAARTDVDWVRLSSVILPYQVLLEGLAQAMPLFTSPADLAVVTRVRIEHYQQLVRAELHLAINAGVSVAECAAHAQGRIPWWTKNDIANELTDRSVDPFLRSYLWSYPAGLDWFAALADTADQAMISAVLHAAFQRPLTPTDLAALWPAGPIIGGTA